jgi:rubrerythrin
MISDGGLTALEVIGVAIKSEIEAAELYARMRGQVRNASLAAKLDFLRREEEKHRVMLEELYVKRFPDVDLQLPAQSAIPKLDQASLGGLTMPELFEMAMEAEQLAAGFYLREAARSRDEVSRTILRYLGNIEQGHQQMLQTEYELVSRFPNYYNADEFHIGDQMMHVGP